jgi:hypothetical protein
MMRTACFAAAALFALSSAGLAATKTLVIDRGDLFPRGSSFRETISGSIEMPDDATAQAGVMFVLPKNFKKNSVAKLALEFAGDGLNCTYYIDVVSLTRNRLGVAEAYGDTTSTMGVAAVVAGPTPAPVQAVDDFRAFKKVFTMAKPEGMPITSQKAGDRIAARIWRKGDDVTDTCVGRLYLIGAKLIYQTP